MYQDLYLLVDTMGSKQTSLSITSITLAQVEEIAIRLSRETFKEAKNHIRPKLWNKLMTRSSQNKIW